MVTPHIGFKHIKGKENELADSLSRLRCLGLHNDNETEGPSHEYCISFFDMDENMVNSIDSNQNSKLIEDHIF